MSRSPKEYEKLFAICYQIAGSILLSESEYEEKEQDIKLLLNTLSRPNGQGATVLLANNKPYQDVTEEALKHER